MPPDIDLYALTKHRDRETIEMFLNSYVDRGVSEDREDEELMMLPLDQEPGDKSFEDYDWEPAKSLSNIVRRGLDYPRRSFTVYLTPNQAGIDRVILSFSSDNQVVLGLSIDDEEESSENVVIAKELLLNLMEKYNCHLGLITVEQPAPVNEEAFRNQMKSPYTIYFHD